MAATQVKRVDASRSSGRPTDRSHPRPENAAATRGSAPCRSQFRLSAGAVSYVSTVTAERVGLAMFVLSYFPALILNEDEFLMIFEHVKKFLP